LISGGRAALIAGTGFANGARYRMSREGGAGGAATQQNRAFNGRARVGTMQRDSGGASGMKGRGSTDTKRPDSSGMKASESTRRCRPAERAGPLDRQPSRRR